MMAQFILNLKIPLSSFKPNLVPKMFSLRQIISTPNFENMWLRQIKSAPKTSLLPGAKFNPRQN